MRRLRSLRPYVFRRPSLEGGGARVDIDLTGGDPPFDGLDLYQRSHWRRYEFALEQFPSRAAVADLACGTGYGSILLSRKASRVVGVDIDAAAIAAARRRYRRQRCVEFVLEDLRDFECDSEFDVIVSFETIEHFDERAIAGLLRSFGTALKPGGRLVYSTPYRQERSPEAIELGFHETFLIDEPRVEDWLRAASFEPIAFYYQDYATHDVRPERGEADFLIGIAERRNA
ncbi:MAG TPA: class I SAM-dependent methyltransferase [Gaiellaceae bacterium]|jgi:SAM-dependent methyltransferase